METLEFEATEDAVGERLDRAVAAAAREHGFELSNSKAKRLVEDGLVRLDDREAWKASRRLRQGQRVAVRIPADVVQSDRDLVSLTDAVIYRDDVMIAVNKPAGVPTHATHDPDRDHVRAAVRRLLAERGVSEPYVAVHHRLDVDTSGVLVFATDESANKGLADAFSERRAKKSYRAIVEAADELPDVFEVADHLGRDRGPSQRAVRSVHSGGDRAVTAFSVVDRAGGIALVEARPETGRTHQIRVHLSEAGSPIVGDTQYDGSPTLAAATVPRMMLHARRLELPHPTRDETLVLEAPFPDDFVQVASALGLTLGEQ